MITDYERWENWRKTEGEAILNRTKTIIASEDENLVLQNVKCTMDPDAYEKDCDESGANWHSPDRILKADIPFSAFSTESQKNIKKKFYDNLEYNLEYNAFEDDTSLGRMNPVFRGDVICGIRDDDIVSVQRDDEWGLFIELYRPNSDIHYAQIKTDDDPIINKLWNINIHSVPVME